MDADVCAPPALASTRNRVSLTAYRNSSTQTDDSMTGPPPSGLATLRAERNGAKMRSPSAAEPMPSKLCKTTDASRSASAVAAATKCGALGSNLPPLDPARFKMALAPTLRTLQAVSGHAPFHQLGNRRPADTQKGCKFFLCHVLTSLQKLTKSSRDNPRN